MSPEMLEELLGQEKGIGLICSMYVADEGYLDGTIADPVGSDGAIFH
jgi:hypothetical protein